ncbi:MAG: hypothetical protein ACR2QF_07345, partial [Geminicoccaceae bacterium]
MGKSRFFDPPLARNFPSPVSTFVVYAVVKINKDRESKLMATLKPDPTFYPSPRMAMKAPPET